MHRFATLLLVPLLGACDSEQKLGTFNAEPLVTITSPADGSAVVAGADVLTGTVSDPDGAVQSLTVAWTRDGLQVCPDADVDEIGNTSCTTSFDEGGGSATLQVTDLGGAAATDTITLSIIADEPPAVVISSPMESAQYYSDQLIKCEGTLSDAEDASEALTAAWESSLDGPLALDAVPDASGTVLDFATLTEGEHALVLSGTDTVGNTTSDSVTIVVGPPNSKPSCEIIAPESGAAPGRRALVQFEGLATDPDVDADQLLVEWSSDKAGSIGASTPSSNGDVLFLFSGLTPDAHAITMTVTDEVGATCTDLISYTVGTAPTITLTAPVAGAVAKLGALVSFSAEVADSEDSPTNLTLDWTSSLDGGTGAQGADSSGPRPVSN